MKKDFLFFLLVLLGVIDFTNYVFLIPILPDFLQKQGVSLTVIGFILSTYQVSNIVAALYLAKNLVHFSKTKVIIIGQMLLTFSNVAMAFLNQMEPLGVIITMAIVLRLIQGVSLACIASTTYSYVPMLYPKDLDRKYAFMEIGTGIGLSLGPVIAGFLYEYLGFTWSFLTMSIVYFVDGLCIFPFLLQSDKILVENKEGEQGEAQEEVEPAKPISIRRILLNKDFLLTSVFFVVSLMSYSIIQPDFSDHIHSYGESDEVVGLIFGLGDLTYALTGFLMMHFLSKVNIKRKYFFIFGCTISMISLLLVGPEEYTFVPHSLISVVVGIGILGFSQMFYVPTFIPEILDILGELDPNGKGNQELASCHFMAMISVTQFIGSILGGYLSDTFGFDRGMAIYALIMLVFIVIFGFTRQYKNKKKEEIAEGVDLLMGEEQVSFEHVLLENEHNSSRT